MFYHPENEFFSPFGKIFRGLYPKRQEIVSRTLEIVFRTSRNYIQNTVYGYPSFLDCIGIFKEWYPKVQDIVSGTLTDCIRNLNRLYPEPQ